MSTHATDWVWQCYRGRASKHTLCLAIADEAKDDGVCRDANLGTLSFKARLSKSQTIRLVDELEEDGDLHVIRARGRGLTNTYVMVELHAAWHRAEARRESRRETSHDETFSDRSQNVARCDLCPPEKVAENVAQKVAENVALVTPPKESRSVDQIDPEEPPQPPAQRGADEGSDPSKGSLRALGLNPRAVRREHSIRDGLRRWVERLAEAFVADDDPQFIREQLAYQLEQQTQQPADVRAALLEAGYAAWLRIHQTPEAADA